MARGGGGALDQRRGLLLSPSSPPVPCQSFGIALDVVQQPEELQRFLRDRAAVRAPEVVELSSRVGQAACLDDAMREGGLVSRVVVADQRAVPAAARNVRVDAKKVPCVFPAAA